MTGVAAAIDVGAEPIGLVLEPSAGRLYVSNATDGTLSVIDLAAAVATDTIDAGTRPASLAIDSGRGLLYVGDVGDDGVSPAQVLVVDTATLEVADAIPVGALFGSLAVDPEAQRAYFLSPEPGDTESLQVIDTVTGELGDALVIGNMLGGPLLDAEHGIVFVTRHFGGALVAVQAAALEITEEVEVGTVPSAGLRPVALDSAQSALYLSEFEGPLHVLDSASLEVIATIPMGSGVPATVASVAIDPVAGVAYVVKDRAGEVLVIDTTTHEVVDTISLDLPDTDGGPGAAVVDPATGTLYIVDRARGVVHVLDSGTAS